MCLLGGNTVLNGGEGDCMVTNAGGVGALSRIKALKGGCGGAGSFGKIIDVLSKDDGDGQGRSS